jgi:bile acid:Na+ symporter, BASS family
MSNECRKIAEPAADLSTTDSTTVVDTSKLISLLNVTALVAIMLSMGLQVKVEEVVASARPASRLVLGLVANYIIVPGITIGLLYAFQADAMVSMGFFILAACPGAPIGPPITGIARGDIPLAIGMMLILAALSALLSPGLLSVFHAVIGPELEMHFNSLAIVKALLITQLLPLAVGLGIRHGAPRMTARIIKPVALIANAMLLVLVVLIIATEHETLAAIRLKAWMGMVLLLLASLGIGWLCGGPDVMTRKALALTTATRNVAVALVIAQGNFADTPAVTAVVAYGLISTLGALGFALGFAAVPNESRHGRL